MIRIIDQLFAGWQPHDIVWYSWCMMAGMILLVWAIGIGVMRKARQETGRNGSTADPGQHLVRGSSYDLPLGEVKR